MGFRAQTPIRSCNEYWMVLKQDGHDVPLLLLLLLLPALPLLLLVVLLLLLSRQLLLLLLLPLLRVWEPGGKSVADLPIMPV